MGEKKQNKGLGWHFILESLLVQGLGPSTDLPGLSVLVIKWEQ